MIDAVGIGAPSGQIETKPGPAVALLSTVTVSATAVADAGTPQRSVTKTRTIWGSTRSNPVPSRTSARRHGAPVSKRDVLPAAETWARSWAKPPTETTDARTSTA